MRMDAHELRAALGWIEQVEMWEFGSPQGGFEAFLHAWEAPVPKVLPPVPSCVRVHCAHVFVLLA